MENNKVRIIVIGGTFNPPTIAHNILARTAIKELNADKCIFIPVGDKYDRKINYIPAYHRYNMLKLAVETEENQEVSDVEIKSKEQLNTYETLTLLKLTYSSFYSASNQDIELIFVMGSDNLIDLKTWKYYEELLKDFRIAVLPRENDDIDKIINDDEILTKYKNHIYRLNISSTISKYISSSCVRNMSDIKTASMFLKPKVTKYIEENDLYFSKKKKCTIIMGPALSGKTTFRKDNFGYLPCVDLFEIQQRYTNMTYENCLQSYNDAETELINLLKNYNHVVLEHTLIKEKRRTQYIKALKENFKDIEIDVYCIWPHISQYVENYKKRVKMFSKLKRIMNDYNFEISMLEKPVFEEGFNDIYYVLSKENHFEVIKIEKPRNK